MVAAMAMLIEMWFVWPAPPTLATVYLSCLLARKPLAWPDTGEPAISALQSWCMPRASQ